MTIEKHNKLNDKRKFKQNPTIGRDNRFKIYTKIDSVFSIIILIIFYF